MSKISVVMPVYNGEKYLSEAIASVLKQSFNDFEFIIVDDGSTDTTSPIVRSFTDKRIVLIENKHDFIGSLNLGIKCAKSKYIARMDADDIMHIDRLKIQYAIMEEEPSITVCGTWMIPFGSAPKGGLIQSVGGMIDSPALRLLKGNMIFHPTVMIKNEFLKKHNLYYENYAYAEDYKLWFEIAKCEGVFYIESQPLLHYRISDQQVSKVKAKEQRDTVSIIKEEIVSYLVEKSTIEKECLGLLLGSMLHLKDNKMIQIDEITDFYYSIFEKQRLHSVVI